MNDRGGPCFNTCVCSAHHERILCRVHINLSLGNFELDLSTITTPCMPKFAGSFRL